MHKDEHSKKNKRKHGEESTNENKFKKILLKILLIVISIIIIYFAYILFFNNKVDNSSNIEENNSSSQTTDINNSSSLVGAEYLQITRLHINSDGPEYYTVTASLKNTSDSSYENVNFQINLLDEQNNVITSLDYKIDKIEANGESLTFATVKRDLSNCVNYSISLKE